MAFSILTDDNFARANTTPSTTAGSANVTGPATFNAPSTGGNYVDFGGASWAITSQLLSSTALTNASYSTAFLLRPSVEDLVNSQASVTATVPYGASGGAAPCVIVRTNRTKGKAYAASVYYSGGTGGAVFAISILGPGSGTLATLTQSAPNLGNTSGPFVMTLSAVGASPTTLTATIALASTPGTIISTLNVTDSDADLQSSGSMGISANSSSGVAPSFSRFTSYTSDSAQALTLGTLSITQNDVGANVLSLSSALSGGSGTGYSYKIYRGTDPNFTASAGSLLTTVSSMPYTDTTAQAGVQYFYGVVGSDSAATSVNAIPASLSGAPTSTLLYASATPGTQALAIAFIGDSITAGAGVSNTGTMSSPTMPFFCANEVKRLLGTRNVYGVNRGVSGYTTTDWAPGGATYNGAKTAMQSLLSANPNALPIASILLGGNDSASAGTNNGGVSGGLSAAQYQTKLKAIVDQWLADFPGGKVIIHMASWYSPNFKNSSTYLQDGLSRLYSYRAAISSLVAGYSTTNPGRVFVGDTYAFDYFAKNGTAEMQAESGNAGTFFVHPAGIAGSNGLIGTQSLGKLHAQAIAQAVIAPRRFTVTVQ